MQASTFTPGFKSVSVASKARLSRARLSVEASGVKKKAPKGTASVDNDTIRNNLQGTSRFMKSKDWVDPQGRKGKGYGVYKFADKYGANVDGYSPIFSPDEWTESGSTFSLGTKGLVAWAGLLLVLLGVGINLVLSTSALSQ